MPAIEILLELPVKGEDPRGLRCQVLARDDEVAERKAREYWADQVPDIDDYMLIYAKNLED